MLQRIAVKIFYIGIPSTILVAVTFFTWTGLATSVTAQIPDVPGWALSWHDEFNGDNIDTGKWVPLDRQDSFNNEKQYYLPDQVVVGGGNLQITATNQPIANKQYRSGLITSKDLFGPGRFEARIDLPTTQGMWPAFWMNANQVQWPLGGEIDILENRGSQPFLTSSAFHYQKNPGECCDQHQYVFEEYSSPGVNFHSGFHVYAVEWEETQLRFYVDDILHFTVNKNRTMSDANFTTTKNIIINLAIGGEFGGDPDDTTIFPQQMLVDYVRIWQPQAGLAGDYNGDGAIDAADYTVWRDSRGQEGIGLPADGSGNGTVGPEDYELWKANFGGPDPPGGGSSSISAPEPTTAVLMSVGMVVLCTRRFGYAVPRSHRDERRMVDTGSRARRT
jgi:beta-glucanase (GH16 family)